MSDLLNKAEYVEGIYTYDRKMLVKFQETKQQVADYKDDLEEDKNEMEVMELEYKDQKKQLETLIATKKKEVSNFDSQLAQAKKDADLYAQTVAKKNEEIRKTKEEEARKKAAEQARKKAEEDARKKAASNTGSRSTNNNNKYSGPSASKSTGGTAQGKISCGLRSAVCGEPLCVWRNQSDKRNRLLRICAGRVQAFWIFAAKKFLRAAFCRSRSLLFRCPAWRFNLLCRSYWYLYREWSDCSCKLSSYRYQGWYSYLPYHLVGQKSDTIVCKTDGRREGMGQILPPAVLQAPKKDLRNSTEYEKMVSSMM